MVTNLLGTETSIYFYDKKTISVCIILRIRKKKHKLGLRYSQVTQKNLFGELKMHLLCP